MVKTRLVAVEELWASPGSARFLPAFVITPPAAKVGKIPSKMRSDAMRRAWIATACSQANRLPI